MVGAKPVARFGPTLGRILGGSRVAVCGLSRLTHDRAALLAPPVRSLPRLPHDRAAAQGEGRARVQRADVGAGGARELNGNFDCLVPAPPPGHGEESGSDALTVAQMVDTVLERVASCCTCVDRAWAIAGHSMGGKVATVVTAAAEAGRDSRRRPRSCWWRTLPRDLTRPAQPTGVYDL